MAKKASFFIKTFQNKLQRPYTNFKKMKNEIQTNTTLLPTKQLTFFPLIHSWRFAIILPFFILCTTAYSQIEVTGAENTGPFSPEGLIENVFLGDGVEVTNLSYDGEINAVGYFTNGEADIGIDRGLVMSTGMATSAIGQANGIIGGATSGPSTDPNLDPIATNPLNDLVKYEITFIPTSDTLRFRYVFASEEYPDFACSDYNDVFGFFISGPNPEGGLYNSDNIALVPEINDPTGLTFSNNPVTINNVNCGSGPGCDFNYCSYYNNNSGSQTFSFNAYLNIFTAQAIVIPCETYTISLALADVGDNDYDTSVFLEAKSFGTGSLEVEAATLSLDGTITEGCSDGVLSFILPSPVESDTYIDYTIVGTAENGVDYEFIPEDLFIAAGDSLVSRPIIAFEDGILESAESIGIDVQRDPCNRDTFWIFIRDNTIVDPEIGPDQIICVGDSIQLDGTLAVPLPDPPNFSSNSTVVVAPHATPITSDIQVFGVQPADLGPGVIKSVCIDSLTHFWVDDLDIYLISPGGQFIELTTDNGANGWDYINTCFTPTATDTITGPGTFAPASYAPFTGDWYPEGDWNDLYGDNPTNGTWQLRMIDDTGPGLIGTLHSWSICFTPLYQINYSWAPATGLSCTDCPNPIASPTETTTYYLTASDTYGCVVYDSITIETITLEAPEATCTTITENSITVEWPDLPDANSYEVNIDNAGWVNSSDNLSHLISGLDLNTCVDILIRGVGDCLGDSISLNCCTPDCVPATPMIESSINPTCGGNADGTITASVMGTSPPYEYTLDGETNTTGIFTDLAAGTYTVNIVDALGCPTSIQAMLDEPDPIESTEIVLSTENCSVSLTVTLTNGVAPYSFSWSNAQTDSIATNLPFGIHYVTITDLNGCSAVDTIEVTSPDPIDLNMSTDLVSCFGLATGTASVVAMGGLAPYTYLWSDPSAQDTPTAIDLLAGNYTVTVTDANGCSTLNNITVDEPLELTSLSNSNDVACGGGSTGDGTVTATGGTPPYSFIWNNGETTGTINSLLAGTYFVTVSDLNGCTTLDSIIIAESEPIVLSIEPTDINCNGDNTGSATITATGGAGGYTYLWNDANNQTTATASNLTAQNYTVTVTDINGCTMEMNTVINEPTALVYSSTQVNVNCSGDDTGSIELTITGGVLPYTVNWSNGASGLSVFNLTNGDYTATIIDANGCEATENVTITEATALVVTNDITDVNCFNGTDGLIDISVAGGTIPYTFSWTSSSGFTNTTEDINDIPAGNYFLTVTDMNGCSDISNYMVTQPIEGVSTFMSPPDTICAGLSDGIAMVSASGGNAPYSYIWSDGQTTPTAVNLSAGTHFVTVSDVGDCTYIDSIIIREAAGFELLLSQTSSACSGGNDGTASVDDIVFSFNGIQVDDYIINWNTNPIQTGEIATGLVGGESYTVTVVNLYGCSATASITIDTPEPMSAQITETSAVNCTEGEDGFMTVQGNGGSAPYTYFWSPNTGTQTTETANNLPIGNYAVTVTDINGCFAVATGSIDEPPALELELAPNEILCKGNADGSIVSFIEGGVEPYVYEWSNGETTSNIESLTAGDYNLSVTDANGCTIVMTTNIDEPELALDMSYDVENVDCNEGQNGMIALAPEGGTPPYTYSLDGVNFDGANIKVGMTAGFYPAFVRDGNGCIFEYPELIEIRQPSPVTVDLGPDQVIPLGTTLELTPEVTFASGDETYSWSLEDSTRLSCTSCPSPIVTAQESYTYELVVVDENGCVGEDLITIFIEKNQTVHVPTGFSPNGDGQNDRLVIHGLENTIISLFRVYDRWGELLYESTEVNINDPDTGWDGVFRGKNMNPGVYVWYVEVEYVDGQRKSYKGNTTLIR